MNHDSHETFLCGDRPGPGGPERRAAQAPAGRPDHVKGLLIGLTDDGRIGRGVAADLKLVEGYLQGLPGFYADQDLVVLSGGQVTPANIEQAIDDLDVGPNDVLFCYYSGHGAYDASLPADDDASGGHFFQLSGGDLRRADLLGWLQDKGARLTVLMTDTCNVSGDFNPSDPNDGDVDRAAGEDQDPTPADEPVVSRAFQTLLFDYTGVVDVSGASQGQFGWAGRNGLATAGLTQALDEDEALDDSTRLDWGRFIADASNDIHNLYQQMKDDALSQPEPNAKVKEFHDKLRAQDDQRPQVFALDVQLVAPAPDGGI